MTDISFTYNSIPELVWGGDEDSSLNLAPVSMETELVDICGGFEGADILEETSSSGFA